MTQESCEGKNPIPHAEIQTLFSSLTQIILEQVKTKQRGIELMVMVCNWAGLIVATIIIMLEDSKSPKSSIVATKMATAFYKIVEDSITRIRGLSGKEERKIITPK